MDDYGDLLVPVLDKKWSELKLWIGSIATYGFYCSIDPCSHIQDI